MKKIMLTKGQFAKVDDEDFEQLSKFKWRLILSHNKIKYAARGHIAILMHRQILGIENIKGHTIEVDHLNRDGLDNRKQNLRATSGRNNQLNTGLRSNNTTGYKGIWFDPTRNKWQAHLRTGKKLKRIGRYDTKEEAATAYKNYVGGLIL